MGVNTTVIIVQPLGDKELNTGEILKGLRVHAVVEQGDLDFEQTLSRLWDRSSVAATAATTHKGKIIFVDDARNIDIGTIPLFTAVYPAEVLQIENSDTTDTGEFSFWKEGELIRKVSSGLEEWMSELDGMGIADKEIVSHFESVDIGAPLEFEKESSHPMNVLASYCLDYFYFYELRWTIFQIIR